MATARDILTKDEPERPATTTLMGGTLSTVELIRARKAYTNYVVDFDGNGDPLAFEEWVTSVYKKGK